MLEVYCGVFWEWQTHTVYKYMCLCLDWYRVLCCWIFQYWNRILWNILIIIQDIVTLCLEFMYNCKKAYFLRMMYYLSWFSPIFFLIVWPSVTIFIKVYLNTVSYEHHVTVTCYIVSVKRKVFVSSWFCLCLCWYRVSCCLLFQYWNKMQW